MVYETLILVNEDKIAVRLMVVNSGIVFGIYCRMKDDLIYALAI